METVINTIAGSTPAVRQRAAGTSPTSERRETRVARADANLKGPEDKPRDREVKRAADRLNKALQELNQNLTISVHEGTGVLVAKVTDPATGDVIQQIPPEQLLEVEANIGKIVGLFVNDTA